MKRPLSLVILTTVTALVATAQDASDPQALPLPPSLTRLVAPDQPLTLTRATELADAQRIARYGACGLVKFKAKQGSLWIFETQVGYAGTSAPDIVIADPKPTLPAHPSKLVRLPDGPGRAAPQPN